MKHQLAWVIAASLGVGGLGLIGCERSPSGTPQATNTENRSATADQNLKNKEDASRVAGSQIPGDQIGSVDLNNIYSTIGDTVEAALTRDGFDDMAERFVEADRNRLGDIKTQKFDDLNTHVDTLRNDWKGKFNGDFKIDDKDLENWLTVSKSGETSDKTMAKAVIPASHGLPAVTIPLVKDNMAWRIDLPDNLNTSELKSRVMSSLTKLDSDKANWPGDQLEAKRHVVHSFYNALFGAGSTAAGSAGVTR